MTNVFPVRHRLALAGLLVAAAVLACLTALPSSSTRLPASAAASEKQQNQLFRTVHALQNRLHRLPQDSSGWAELGSAYVELSRVTADPGYYTKAQGALERSLTVRQDGNGPAMLGMGSLANVRHDFAAAKDWALKAKAVLPDSAEVHGVLADALTQLGDDAGATGAVQRMLDLRPGTASFTRASYQYELHGDVPAAREAMERALAAASSPDETAFCRYQLGELALNDNRLDDASEHFELGLEVREDDMALRQGKAKVAAARGDTEDAVEGYRQIVSRAPVPQYMQEYAELLESIGRQSEAEQQYAVLAETQRLAEVQGASDDLNAALVAADHGDPAEALRRAEAEWGRRQSVFVADAMAWALHVNGRDAEALEYAERAAALGWRNATFAYHRGMILASLGRAADAERFLVEALNINPHFSSLQALTAGRKLAELRGGR